MPAVCEGESKGGGGRGRQRETAVQRWQGKKDGRISKVLKIQEVDFSCPADLGQGSWLADKGVHSHLGVRVIIRSRITEVGKMAPQ